MAQVNLPYYNEDSLPCLKYPVTVNKELPERYLGTKAVTKPVYVNLNLHGSTDLEVDALHTFWEVNCNYGLDPFVMAISINGYTASNLEFDFFLMRFTKEVQYTKGTKNWTIPVRAKVVGVVTAIVDDNGNLVVSDSLDGLSPDSLILSDAVDYYMSDTQEIASYRKVIFGKDDTVKINYDMETINTKFDDSRTMDNKAISGQVYDGKMNGSNHVKIFNGVQSVPLNIQHTLGAEIASGYMNAPSPATVTAITNGSNIAFTYVSTGLNNIYLPVSDANVKYCKISFYAVVKSGSFIVDAIYDGSKRVSLVNKHTIVTGLNEFVIPSIRVDTSTAYLYPVSTTQSFDIDFTFSSAKPISIDNSYLTMYDPIGKVFNTLGNGVNGGTNIELLEDGDFSSGTVGSWLPLDVNKHIMYVSNKMLYVQSILGTSALRGFLTFPFVEGKKYRISALLDATACPNTMVLNVNSYAGTVSALNVGTVISGSSNTVTGSITARADDDTLWFGDSSGTIGAICGITNITITEVLPDDIKYLQENDFSNAVATNVPVNDSDRAYLKLNPEAIGDLWFDKKAHPQLSFDKTNIIHWYPANEGEEGGEKIFDVTKSLLTNPNYDFTSGGTDYSVIVSGSGSVTFSNNQAVFTDCLNVWLNELSVATEIGDFCVIEVDVASLTNNNGGYIQVKEAGGWGSTALVVGKNTFTRIVDLAGGFRLYARGDGVETYVINSFKVTNYKKDYSKINSFDVTCRTTHLKTDHGASNLFMKQDPVTGRVVGMSDLNTVEFNGASDGINTGWTPDLDADWSVELVTYFESTGTEQAHGVAYENPTNRITISVSVSGYLFARIGDNIIHSNVLVVNNYINAILTYEHITKTFVLYLNSIKKVTDIGTFSGTTQEFVLGKQGDSTLYHVTGKGGYFRVYNKVLNQSEVTKVYNDAKVIYPTLP